MTAIPLQTPSMTLAGHYTLRPGQHPSITGQRPLLGGGRLGRLLRGQQGESIVRTLGNVFTLCAHAHRRTARLALHAASPQKSAVLSVEAPVLLRLETAHDLSPARCLAAWHPLACTLTPQTHSLDLLNLDTAVKSIHLRAIAQAMANDPDFVQRPLWRGQCAQTGAWTRLRQPAKHGTLAPNAWTRLSARWMELVNITSAAPLTDDEQHAPLLDSGSLLLDQGQAIAWCEMARGRLLPGRGLRPLRGLQRVGHRRHRGAR